MYGLEAINAGNGWAISVVGVTVVFTGLVLLSLIISQLHKVLALWEDPSKLKQFFSRKKPEPVSPEEEAAIAARAVLTGNQKEVIGQYALLVRTLEDHFSLTRLLHLAQISGLKDPYQHLNILFKTRIILPDGDGFFTWNKEVFDKTVD